MCTQYGASNWEIRASMLRGLPLVKVGLFSGEIYHHFVAQTWKGA
ncbi:hypothetical protein [Vibrio mytili]|nr:hypothetical protein [Vibrio mytili]